MTPPTRLDEIKDLYAYNRWADAVTLDAVTQLDAEQFHRHVAGSFPTLRDTLLHMLAADWIWLERWKGTSPRTMPDGWANLDLDGLRTRWAEVEEAQKAFVDGLDAADLDGIVAYRNMRGDAMAQPLWMLLRHVVNHATYHRGQVVNQIREVGGTPGATDFVIYQRLKDRGEV